MPARTSGAGLLFDLPGRTGDQHATPVSGGEAMFGIQLRLVALLLTAAPIAASALDLKDFDGDWTTTVSCAAARDALGYSFQFVSVVKDGVLHGVRGKEGEPSSLRIDGTITADGEGQLYVKGRTGSKEYVPGRDTPRGTEYGYDVIGHFDAHTGTGTRVEGRPCSLKFVH